MKKSIKELSEIKAAKRKKRYNNGKKMRGIYLRKALHFIVAVVLKIDQITEKKKIVIIGDKRCLPRGKPIIYELLKCSKPLNRSEINNSVVEFQNKYFGKAASDLGFTIEDTVKE